MIRLHDESGQLIEDVCARLLAERDEAYDGAFFVCVKTTKVYCRSTCRVKHPLPKNRFFVPTAAAAEQLGFRPCLRCRPESTPGSPAWKGTAAVVARGIGIINGGFLDQNSVEQLATRLGLSVRHVDRLFQKHAHASPQAIAMTRRLQIAKRLVSDTALPFTEVAMESGFRSVRRFNDAFRRVYNQTPTEIRCRNPAN